MHALPVRCGSNRLASSFPADVPGPGACRLAQRDEAGGRRLGSFGRRAGPEAVRLHILTRVAGRRSIAPVVAPAGGSFPAEGEAAKGDMAVGVPARPCRSLARSRRDRTGLSARHPALGIAAAVAGALAALVPLLAWSGWLEVLLAQLAQAVRP